MESDQRPVTRRRLRRDRDGSLYDPTERRQVTIGDLRDDLRDGRGFRAYRHESGADCTYEVLVEVLGAALPGRPPPGDGDVGAAVLSVWQRLRDGTGTDR